MSSTTIRKYIFYLTVVWPCNWRRWLGRKFYNTSKIYGWSFVDENIWSAKDFGNGLCLCTVEIVCVNGTKKNRRVLNYFAYNIRWNVLIVELYASGWGALFCSTYSSGWQQLRILTPTNLCFSHKMTMCAERNSARQINWLFEIEKKNLTKL